MTPFQGVLQVIRVGDGEATQPWHTTAGPHSARSDGGKPAA